MALREVSFTDDHRRKKPLVAHWTSCFTVTGVVEASVLVTSASDHIRCWWSSTRKKTPPSGESQVIKSTRGVLLAGAGIRR